MNNQPVLLDLLRCELDATNHQFTHILALQQWEFDEVAARITEIDNVDFVNAMRIIGYFVCKGTPFSLDKPEFKPGTDLASILRAEQSSEKRLLAALERAQHLDAETQSLADFASAPREAYARWLDRQIATALGEPASVEAPIIALQDLVARLITMIEQALVHAYVERHGGCAAAADAAWTSSGAAMMHLTRLVKLFAKLPGVPSARDCPAANLQLKPGKTLAADRELAQQCTQAARQAAADCEHVAIARYCSSIANSYQAFVDWDPALPHPEHDSTPAIFHSFQASLDRFGL